MRLFVHYFRFSLFSANETMSLRGNCVILKPVFTFLIFTLVLPLLFRPAHSSVATTGIMCIFFNTLPISAHKSLTKSTCVMLIW